MESPNKSGRPKRSKRTFKRTVDRFFMLDINLKELRNNYQHLKPGKERIDMIRALLPFHIAPVQPDNLSSQEIDELYHKLEQTVKDASKKAS